MKVFFTHRQQHCILCCILFLLSLLSNTSNAASNNCVYDSFFVGDALVHSAITTTKDETNTKNRPPIIFIPGLNLASYIFATTPDGRTGWIDLFCAAGHDVYVVNDPDFDFAKDSAGVVSPPWTVPENGRPLSQADSAQRWQRDVWKRWGLGESQGNPYANVRFPTDDFDTFAANYPYVGSSASGQSYADAIEALLLQLDAADTPVILAPHSMGGPAAVQAAKNQPSLVLGFVFLEPTRPPNQDDFPALAGMHMFAPYADRIDSRRQSGRKQGVEEAAVLFAEHGGMAEVVSLPDDLKIYGNTHLFMQDDNNEFVADLILDAVSEWSMTSPAEEEKEEPSTPSEYVSFDISKTEGSMTEVQCQDDASAVCSLRPTKFRSVDLRMGEVILQNMYVVIWSPSSSNVANSVLKVGHCKSSENNHCFITCSNSCSCSVTTDPSSTPQPCAQVEY